MSRLTVERLTVEFGKTGRRLTAVRDVSFSVEPGKTLGIVGESGSGKSTLAKALCGLLEPTAGSIRFGGDAAVPRHRRVQMVFQNPYASLNPRMTVQDALDEAARMCGDRARRRDAVDRLLSSVRLSRSIGSRYPHELSGGQRQRVAVARALAVEPNVLILDEATSALDVSVQAALLQTLRDLQAEFGFASLFISHDLAVVREVSSHVAVMYFGRIVELAEADDLFRMPAHPYTRVLLASTVLKDLGDDGLVVGEPPDPQNPPTGCSFHPRCPWGPNRRPERDVCRELDPAVIAGGHTHNAMCHFAESIVTVSERR